MAAAGRAEPAPEAPTTVSEAAVEGGASQNLEACGYNLPIQYTNPHTTHQALKP